MEYLLRKGELLNFRTTGKMEAITVSSGRVWLTRHSDPLDYCLEAGARLPVGKNESIFIEAMDDAAVSLSWRAAPAAQRVTLAWSRSPLTATR